jgi:predicted negative regulator of RcsB-dependent stress response
MRLLVEIVIIAAVIFLGWNKPFKEQVAQASTTIESTLNRTGSKLQKNQDESVQRY